LRFCTQNRSRNAVSNIVSLDGVGNSCKQENANLFAKNFCFVYSSKSVISNLQPLEIPLIDLPNNCLPGLCLSITMENLQIGGK